MGVIEKGLEAFFEKVGRFVGAHPDARRCLVRATTW